MKKYIQWAAIVVGIILSLWLLCKYRLEVKSFFDTYDKVIAAFAYAAVVIGLFFTMVQVRGAKKQAKANTTYQIHRDGRALFTSLDDDVIEYILSADSKQTHSEATRLKAERKIHELLMYYVSIYHQRNFKNIDSQYFTDVFLKEFCIFLNYHRVKEYWKKNICTSESWDEGFKKIGQKCFR